MNVLDTGHLSFPLPQKLYTTSRERPGDSGRTAVREAQEHMSRMETLLYKECSDCSGDMQLLTYALHMCYICVTMS